MIVTPLKLSGLATITPDIHGDQRGFFMNVFDRDVLKADRISFDIVEHNQSHSVKRVLRGLHFQYDPPLSKLIRVIRGKAFFVAVDIRKDSDTCGQFETRELSSENKELFWIPFGFATGFCALEDDTDIEYYFDAHYNPKGETNIVWNDPAINIPWPIQNPLLSERDSSAISFEEWRKR